MGHIRTFRINEDELAELESNLSLILAEGVEWTIFNKRQDIWEAWEMTAKTLSRIRFELPKPGSVTIISTEEPK